MSIERLLRLAAKYDFGSELMWTEDLEFSIMCNDFFAWGCSDAEEVNGATIDALEQAMLDVGEYTIDGALLYCARMRKMRPQNAYYQYLPKELHPLFDACGPEREQSFINPGTRAE